MSSKHKIAVVEDDEPIRNMYCLKLEKAGFTVQSAADGVEARQMLADFKPDLILLDILLPHLTGDAILSELRQTDWGKNTKVIVLTNLSADESPDVLLNLHIVRYLVKAHHTPKQVVEIVEEILKTKAKK